MRGLGFYGQAQVVDVKDYNVKIAVIIKAETKDVISYSNNKAINWVLLLVTKSTNREGKGKGKRIHLGMLAIST